MGPHGEAGGGQSLFDLGPERLIEGLVLYASLRPEANGVVSRENLEKIAEFVGGNALAQQVVVDLANKGHCDLDLDEEWRLSSITIRLPQDVTPPIFPGNGSSPLGHEENQGKTPGETVAPKSGLPETLATTQNGHRKRRDMTIFTDAVMKFIEGEGGSVSRGEEQSIGPLIAKRLSQEGLDVDGVKSAVHMLIKSGRLGAEKTSPNSTIIRSVFVKKVEPSTPKPVGSGFKAGQRESELEAARMVQDFTQRLGAPSVSVAVKPRSTSVENKEKPEVGTEIDSKKLEIYMNKINVASQKAIINGILGCDDFCLEIPKGASLYNALQHLIERTSQEQELGFDVTDVMRAASNLTTVGVLEQERVGGTGRDSKTIARVRLSIDFLTKVTTST